MALTVDALLISWNDRPYLFPPFTLINRGLQKISKEIEAAMVASVWQNQIWYPRLLELLAYDLILLPEKQKYSLL